MISILWGIAGIIVGLFIIIPILTLLGTFEGEGANSRCIGLGWLKGHKFTMLSNGEYRYWSDYCYRCGMPKGGWK